MTRQPATQVTFTMALTLMCLLFGLVGCRDSEPAPWSGEMLVNPGGSSASGGDNKGCAAGPEDNGSVGLAILLAGLGALWLGRCRLRRDRASWRDAC